MRPTTLAWILTPLSFAALLLALHVQRTAEARPSAAVGWDEAEFQWVREHVARTYVDPIAERQYRDAYAAAVNGWLDSLPDDYNDYIPPDAYRKWQDDAAGHYAGVGIQIKALEREGLEISGLFPDGPAARAGIRVGEVIVAVDGRSLADLDLTDHANLRMLKGPPGSRVAVRVKAPRPADAPPETVASVRTVDVVRADIRPPTVFSRRLGPDRSVGYLRVTEFVDTTADDFDRALDHHLADGVRAVVVDLRRNGGGVLPATVRCADRFVRSGDIVRMAGRTPSSRRSEVAHDAGTIPDAVALAVLVDPRSASASEVFAGCIQDHKRGVIVGTRTYGKFLVQNIVEVPGRGSALKVTTARYVTPNGRSFQRDPKRPDAPAGLIPDVVLELSAEERAKLDKTFDAQEDAVWGARRDEPGDPEWVDPQLQRALDVLAGKAPTQEIRGGTRAEPRKG